MRIIIEMRSLSLMTPASLEDAGERDLRKTNSATTTTTLVSCFLSLTTNILVLRLDVGQQYKRLLEGLVSTSPFFVLREPLWQRSKWPSLQTVENYVVVGRPLLRSADSQP